MLIALNKPYGVITQFTPKEEGQRTLAEFGFAKNVYPIGRLDLDSEGLLFLSDDGRWTDFLLNPRNAHERTYHVQVDGRITDEALSRLKQGPAIQGEKTRPCKARRLEPEPAYAPRVPPIRVRLSIPTSWIELKLIEGKNRQVRRMTAAVGFPTLRLIRTAIGPIELGDLPAGKWRQLSKAEEELLFK